MRRRLMVTLGALVALACGGDDGPTADDDGVGGDVIGSIVSGGLARSFVLRIPPTFDRNVPAPLLVALHGSGQTAAEFKSTIGIDDDTDAADLVVVYPDGVARSWAIGANTNADQLGINDLQFFQDLVDAIAGRVPINTSRVYVTGISLGAQMAQVLACRFPGRIAAIASVAASVSTAIADGCVADLPVPALFMLGTEDPIFLWEGIEGQLLSGPETIDFWRGLNGCTDAVDEETLPDAVDDSTRVRVERYRECEGDSEVVLYAVEGGGHTWPGSAGTPAPSLGRVSQDISGGEVIAEFLSRHTRTTGMVPPPRTR